MKIMSMEEYANDHFNETNMPSYPQSKMHEIQLCNGRWQLKETKVSLSTDVGDAKAATTTGIPVRKERRNKQCFQLLRHIREYFPSVSECAVSGKQSLPEPSWDKCISAVVQA